MKLISYFRLTLSFSFFLFNSQLSHMPDPGDALEDSEAAGLLMLFSGQQNTDEKRPSDANKLALTKSPGPAAAARASNKARVAAAALAAAAATPIPILHHRSNSFPDDSDSVSPELQKIEPKPSPVVKAEPVSEPVSEPVLEPVKPLQEPQPVADPLPAVTVPQPTVKDQVETETEDDQELLPDHKKPIKKPTKKVKKQKDPPPEYAVNPDSGIIGCICQLDHDDGFTIQCDKCFRWQHAACMNIENEDVPDNYLCYLCEPNSELNAEKARKLQESRLQPKRRKSPYETPSSNGVNGLDPKTGAAQFKKRKNNNGVDKFQTYYYPINYNIFKSSMVKSLYLQLPNLLKDNKNVLQFDKSQLKKSLINQNNLNVKSSYDNPKSKFTGITKVGLFTSHDIKQNQLISIFAGEVDIKQNYILEKSNLYGLLGCPKPCVFFHPNLPIVIDQRGMGNHTRFIRKSCTPNCEIKTILNNNDLIFCLSSTTEIEYDDELTLPWSWDENHPINKIIKNNSTFENLDDNSKLILFNSLHNLLDLTECACSSNGDCLISKLKRIIPQFKNSKKYQYAYSPFPNQSHTPIIERYKIRDDNINDSNGLQGDMTLTEGETKDNNGVHDDDNNNSIIIDPYELIFEMDDIPNKFKLIKEFKNTNSVLGSKDIDLKNVVDDNLYTPIGLSSKLMSKLEAPNKVENGVQNDDQNEIDKPKIKKKFSLADYKKKKTSV